MTFSDHGEARTGCLGCARVDDHDSEIERLEQVIENQSALLALTLEALEELGFPLEGFRALMLD
jgi:hypothetical protein